MNQITVGVITVSDRASQGFYDDLGGPALKEAATRYGWQILAEAIIPDDVTRIRETVRSFSAQGCALILTTGGTGAALRDVTPEAIRSVMRVELPGFGEVMRAESMKLTPNAILSRSPGGYRRSLSGDRSAGQTARRGGMPRIRYWRHSTRGEHRAGADDFLLKLFYLSNSPTAGRNNNVSASALKMVGWIRHCNERSKTAQPKVSTTGMSGLARRSQLSATLRKTRAPAKSINSPRVRR